MKRAMWLRLVLSGLAVAPAAPAAAQIGATGQCELTSSGGVTNINRALGITWIGGGALFHCPRGVTIRADSAVLMETQGMAEFVGAVRYTDSTRVMTADWAQYQRDQAILVASGNVTLSDQSTGTTIRNAPYMTYYQSTETRPEELIYIPSGRPEAVLVRAGEAGAVPDTTWIVADQLNIHGKSRFLARGDVVITRTDVRGTGREAEYTEELHELRLHGAARLVGEDYELTGDTIIAHTDEAERLREVVARGAGELVSDESDVRVSAPFLRITLVDGEVERLVAVVPLEARGVPPAVEPEVDDPDAERAAEPVRARAVSSDFTLIADSIDARTPDRQLEEVIAIGHAYAERLDVDSSRVTLPAVIAKDWVKGDTIVATFGSQDTAAGQEERVIEQLTAIGAETPAAALAMLRDEAREPSFSYQIARWIQIRFSAGEVDVVEVDGLQQGLHLQPESAARTLGPRAGRGGGSGGS